MPGRTLAILLTAMMLTSLAVMAPPALADSPPSNGGVVDSDQTWDSGTLSGSVTIEAGVTVTVSGDISVAKDASLDVQGTLDLQNGSLTADEPPSDFQWWNNFGQKSRLWIPESDAGNSFSVTIHSSADYNLSNFTVQWKDGAKTPMSGDEYTFGAGLIPFVDDGGAWLSFEMEATSWGELVIDRIVLDNGVTDAVTFEASDLDGPGWILRGDAGFTLNVASGGSLGATNSMISGASVTISGSTTGANSWFNDSGPVSLLGDSSITWNGGGFNGSSDDHDILASVSSTIDVQNIDNTGGFIDIYERHMASQVLQFPGSGATFTLTGVGPNEVTYQGLSVSDGTFVVAGDEANGVRVVEIGYADGTTWTETATISNIEWFTAWGTYSDAGGALPHEENPSIIIAILPVVSVSGVEVTDGGTLGKRATVTVTMTNTGSGHANNVAIECYEDEERADISPAYPFADVPAGSSSEVELRWGHAQIGNATLTCQPLTPTQIAINGILGGGSTDSQQTAWAAAEDASGMSPWVISLLVALVVGVLLVAYFTAVRGLNEEPKMIRIERDDLDELDEDLEELDD